MDAANLVLDVAQKVKDPEAGDMEMWLLFIGCSALPALTNGAWTHNGAKNIPNSPLLGAAGAVEIQRDQSRLCKSCRACRP